MGEFGGRGAAEPGPWNRGPPPPGSRHCVCEVSGMARAVRCGAWSLAVVSLICPSGIHSSACWARRALCRALGCSCQSSGSFRAVGRQNLALGDPESLSAPLSTVFQELSILISCAGTFAGLVSADGSPSLNLIQALADTKCWTLLVMVALQRGLLWSLARPGPIFQELHLPNLSRTLMCRLSEWERE